MPALEVINARLLAGEQLSFATIYGLFEMDPALAAALSAIAKDRAAGVELTLADCAQRTGLPLDLLTAVEMARVHGAPVVAAQVLPHTGSYH